MDKAREPRKRVKRTPKPLDEASLEELAFGYVARFATTSGKFQAYLQRKVRERGWEGQAFFDPVAIAERFVASGYIDDAGWARGKSASLTRRGYGARRVGQALHAAGIGQEIREENAPNMAKRRAAALTLVRKRRFGPFGEAFHGDEGRKRREKQLAAMVRAGHDFDIARHVLDASSEADLEEWLEEAREDDWE